MEEDTVRGCFKPGHHFALFVSFGVSTADKHDTGGCPWVHHQCLGVEVDIAYTFQKFYKVALYTQHDAFCFRIAHTDVVFYHHWFTFHTDQAEEDEAFVKDVFFLQSADGRFDDAGTYLFHKYLVGKGDRSYTSHATGIQAFIAFTDAFVIFGNRQNLIVLTVCQHKYGALYTAEEFFDNNCGAGLAKHTAEHFFQFPLGFFQCRENEHTFSGA